MTQKLIFLCTFGIIILCMIISTNARNVESNSVSTDKIEERSISGGESFGSRGLLLAKSLLLAPIGLALIFVAFLTLLPTTVAAGRSFQMEESRALGFVKKIVDSDECLERIVCEVSKVSRMHQSTSWIPGRLQNYMRNTRWEQKMARGIDTKNPCGDFACSARKALKFL